MKKIFKWGAIVIGVLIVIGVIAAAVGGSDEGSPDRTLTPNSATKEPRVAATTTPRVTMNDLRSVFVEGCTENGALTREQCRCAFDLAFAGMSLQDLADLTDRDREDYLLAAAIVCSLQE